MVRLSKSAVNEDEILKAYEVTTNTYKNNLKIKALIRVTLDKPKRDSKIK